MNLTLQTKNITTFTDKKRGDIATWGDSTATWGDSNFSWGLFSTAFNTQTKNITTFTNQTKL